ncbi:MAG: DUF3717 domain-containing protein [Gallionellaceae bacterium]|nr:DUF3717 domain-containing protein [Gallionellaceae bacterium]
MASQILTIQGISDAIHQCVQAHPNVDHAISAETSALADIYGFMIFHRAKEIDFGKLVAGQVFGAKHENVVKQFYRAEG